MKVHKRITLRDKNGDESVEYDGLYNDRKDVDASPTRIGVSIGTTVNMGSYQSLRVDVWCAEDVPVGKDKNAHFMDLRKQLNEQLQSVIADYSQDD